MADPAGDGDDLIKVHADAGRFFQSQLEGSWTALTNHLRVLGYPDDTLLRSGLVTEGKFGLCDRFRDRLMIQLRRAKDRVAIAFIGRRPPGAGDEHGPKYLNSPTTELFTKGQVLVGLAEGHRFLEQGAQPVLVEGPMDAIAVSIAAPSHFVGVAPCGTALTGEQVAELARVADLTVRGVRARTRPSPRI